ncbi:MULTISPECIES: F0F1 ATP synthase subunit B [Corynebacterium]|uniref:ATP synthase subunit b n=1 Tax=Corynebacterium kefirresidentii TaxID=1979527 RepID=A0ABT8Q5I2_9CORY|nr:MULTISPECIES: F0F1 ATP synthase subunit B [Corynebacterium]WKS52682.1 F0F1 ATP synthase subunit B [Corynebacterium tuberculostearicum]ERS46548.1 ATP synthase F0, B subunit [Corynebacterium sp. KPL1860]ERS48131.1 ATP synthase F0, B subunit [Corynebacterium sp. KPL1856]ERS53653.1 ATP synthase F0, B subunit [Corynebacterium sp. KPL1821]ERS59455.1 ATP synthase F0, B subunit [Corynebacterium sp. KPL1817]
MNNVVYLLAAEGGDNPGSGSFSVLLPKNYDIFWSLLCFIVILLLFWKFVIPMYSKMLAEREDRIEGGLKRAKAQQAEAKAALEKYNAQLADARAEAAEIREQARERGKQIEAEAKTNAEEESRRIVANGEKQLEASRSQVVTELRSEMGQNSINLAEKILGGELSDASKKSSTIDGFLSELDSVAPAGK